MTWWQISPLVEKFVSVSREERKVLPWGVVADISLAVFSIVLGLGLVWWRLKSQGFDQTYGFSTLPPWGYDFRLSMEWGRALWNGGLEAYLSLPNAWPPFATVFYLPLGFLDNRLGYQLLVVSLVLALCLSVSLGLRFYTAHTISYSTRYLILALLVGLLAQSFPFIFAVERGNSDLIALAFIALGLSSFQRGCGLQAILLLTVATQLKMYPAILGVLFVLRRQYRLSLLFGVVNVALLFVLGPRALLHFISSVSSAAAGATSEFNHSLFSYLNRLGGEPPLSPALGILVLMALWGVGVAGKWWKTRHHADDSSLPAPFCMAEVGIIGMAFVLMSLIPAISWDYKLVIHLFPYLLVVGCVARQQEPSVILGVTVLALAGCTGGLFLQNSGSPRTPLLLINFALYGIVVAVGLSRKHVPDRSVWV
jgi:hypothetical protein